MAESESKQEHAFDEQRLRRLIELMKEHGLQELELREADQRIRLSRGVAPSAPYGTMPPYATPAYSPPPPAPAASAPAAASAGSSSEAESKHIKTVTSPMVGTFYSKPNPEAQTYVRVGDHVDPETTICIIEAMKVFNEIPAEISGKVTAVLVDNEEPVEFGTPLFRIDTRG